MCINIIIRIPNSSISRRYNTTLYIRWLRYGVSDSSQLRRTPVSRALLKWKTEMDSGSWFQPMKKVWWLYRICPVTLCRDIRIPRTPNVTMFANKKSGFNYNNNKNRKSKKEEHYSSHWLETLKSTMPLITVQLQIVCSFWFVQYKSPCPNICLALTVWHLVLLPSIWFFYE